MVNGVDISMLFNAPANESANKKCACIHEPKTYIYYFVENILFHCP
jgi:hypothetical protein